jgi:hypothetical protein
MGLVVGDMGSNRHLGRPVGNGYFLRIGPTSALKGLDVAQGFHTPAKRPVDQSGADLTVIVLDSALEFHKGITFAPGVYSDDPGMNGDRALQRQRFDHLEISLRVDVEGSGGTGNL